MEDVAETLVAAFCRAAGIGKRKLTPPVEVFDLARRVGAKTVDEESLFEDGRVEDGHRTTLILLRTNVRAERRRFTLAHELGHLVLAEPEVLKLAREALGVEQFDIERMCNVFAAELLMPRRWVIEQFAERQERLCVIDDLAQSASVSVSAAATQLGAVLGWQSTLLYFQRRHDWEPVVIAAGAVRRRMIGLGTRTPSMLRAVPLSNPESIVVRPIEIKLGHIVIETRGELRASHAGVLCLTRFRRVRP